MRQYIDRHAGARPLLQTLPRTTTDITVVLPAYDEPDILRALQSLHDTDREGIGVEVIVVINHPHTAPPEVKHTNETARQTVTTWNDRHGTVDFQVYALPIFDLPHKLRGVGYARKVGMDEAVRRYEMVGNPQGIIAAFDADARCAPNYFKALRDAFRSRPSIDALTVYFEHPLSGDEFSPEVYKAIYEYELHLRYYVQAVRWTGHPQGWHTVGSSMAVRAAAYARMGGMNRRQAGEDFYFLHKFSAVNRLGLLANTTVYPSPRISHKVPFGTGRAVGQLVRSRTPLTTYHPEAFLLLKEWFKDIHLYYAPPHEVSASPAIQSFVQSNDLEEKWLDLRKNTASKAVFERRFFQVVNAFTVMKWLHYYRDHYKDNCLVDDAATQLLKWKSIDHEPDKLLDTYRALDREHYEV